MSQKRKSKNVAVILALTTGFIGGHRFYLGQPLLAVVYIGTLLVGWKQEMVLSLYASRFSAISYQLTADG